MARSYANIDCGIWGDAEFCALSAGAQRTYFMLITQPDITACGSLALTLRRWSATCDEKDLKVWLEELAETRFILLDEDTEEVLVRTFVKWDGGYKHAKRVMAVIATAKAIRSHTLRYTVATEMAKLGVSSGIEVPTEWEPVATQEAIDCGRSVVNVGEYEPHSLNHTPELLPVPGGNDEPTKAQKRARFDEFYAAFPKHVAKAAARRRWDTVINAGTDPQVVIDGAKRYAESVRGAEPQFIKQPDGWLLSGRWEDEPLQPPARPSTPWNGA